MSSLEGDVAQAFACHRRRLRVAGVVEPAGLAAVEQMALLLVRLCVHGGQHPTFPAVTDSGAHSGNVSLLVDLDDVAAELKVSRRTVERLAKAGQLPTVSVGPQAVRVRRDDLAAFVAGLDLRPTSGRVG